MSTTQRFIPASAGNGHPGPKSQTAKPVHPRERGERDARATFAFHTGGSSPRARGTVVCIVTPSLAQRFIPASAGNGFRPCCRCSRAAVHPRERGERARGERLGLLVNGSSPRARGTGTFGIREDRSLRFIPASAGNGMYHSIGQ